MISAKMLFNAIRMQSTDYVLPDQATFYGTKLGYTIDILLPYKYFVSFKRSTGRWIVLSSNNPILYDSTNKIFYVNGSFSLYRTDVTDAKTNLTLYSSGTGKVNYADSQATSVTVLEKTNNNCMEYSAQTTIAWATNYVQKDYE